MFASRLAGFIGSFVGISRSGTIGLTVPEALVASVASLLFVIPVISPLLCMVLPVSFLMSGILSRVTTLMIARSKMRLFSSPDIPMLYVFVR